MGLIRKSLMVTSGGLVSGSSKKQKVAKATMRAEQEQAAALAQMAEETRQMAERTRLANRSPEQVAWDNARQAVIADRQARKKLAKSKGEKCPPDCTWTKIGLPPTDQQIQAWLNDHAEPLPTPGIGGGASSEATLPEQIAELVRLHDEGHLTAEQLEAAKAKLLA